MIHSVVETLGGFPDPNSLPCRNTSLYPNASVPQDGRLVAAESIGNNYD